MEETRDGQTAEQWDDYVRAIVRRDYLRHGESLEDSEAYSAALVGFARAWAKWRPGDRASFKAYLVWGVRYSIWSAMHAEERHASRRAEMPSQGPAVNDEPTYAERRDVVRIAAVLVDRLKNPIEREVIRRHYMRAETITAIACDRDVSVGYVSAVKRRSLRHLLSFAREAKI